METKSGKFFECVVKYDKMMENGMVKKVSETYCIEADNFADAEMRIAEEVAVYSQGDFEIKKITPAVYDEVFINSESDDSMYFKAKLQFITVDEVTAREKKTTMTYLVVAKDFASSLRTIQEVMATSMMDYVTAQIAQSKALDLFWKDGN